MKKTCKRKFTRIPFQSKVDLRFPDRDYLQCDTRDICLSGLWVMDGHERKVGEQCDIEFHKTGLTKNQVLRMRGEVVRVDKSGIALLFTDMNLNSYTKLQSILLDSAEDPFKVAEEFLDSVAESQ